VGNTGRGCVDSAEALLALLATESVVDLTTEDTEDTEGESYALLSLCALCVLCGQSDSVLKDNGFGFLDGSLEVFEVFFQGFGECGLFGGGAGGLGAVYEPAE
jgi:hypothetical protein